MTGPTPPILPLDEAALSFAKRWNLVTPEGQLICIRGCGRFATLPTLCCRECLAARRGGWR